MHTEQTAREAARHIVETFAAMGHRVGDVLPHRVFYRPFGWDMALYQAGVAMGERLGWIEELSSGLRLRRC